MSTQNIEKLFKETFSNFEANVNPSAWANISQGLQTPVPSPTATNTGWFSKIGLNKAVLFIAGIATVIGILIYFGIQKSDTETAVVTNVSDPVKENPVILTPSIEPVVLNQDNQHVIKSTPVEKQSTSQASEPNAPVQKSMVAIVDKPKEKENVSDNSLAPVNVVQEETNPQGQKSAVLDETSSVENTSVINVQPDVNTTTNFPEDIALTEPSYENIVSVPPSENKNLTFFVPNAFSPNGDLVNEYFTPMGLNFKEYELTIFDRSGHEIFKSKDIVNKWDGKLRDGNPAPVDVYVYVINVKDLNNQIHPYTGSITLKR